MKKKPLFQIKYNFVPTNYRYIFKFQYMPLKQKYSNLWKKLKSVLVKKKSVRESEKHGKKCTWNHFFAPKKTSKRGKKLVSRAVLLFKGEETGCILIRSLHLKINFPNRKNIKCSKVKRSIKKKCAKLSEKIMGNKKKTWILGLKMTQSDPSVSQYILQRLKVTDYQSKIESIKHPT